MNVAHATHLVRRFAGSWSRRPLDPGDVAWVASVLTPGEGALWFRLAPADQRHSMGVARRFAAARPEATRAELAGALLHDVGKVVDGLGTLERVAATLAGPRTARWRTYHDHEAIGAKLAEAAGADPVTVALIRGDGPAAATLRAADDAPA